MSMNLTLEGKGAPTIPQTRTGETWMILSYNPATRGPDGRMKPDGGMVGVTRRYLEWYKMEREEYFNSCADDPEVQKLVEEETNEHIAAILAVKRPKWGNT